MVQIISHVRSNLRMTPPLSSINVVNSRTFSPLVPPPPMREVGTPDDKQLESSGVLTFHKALFDHFITRISRRDHPLKTAWISVAAECFRRNLAWISVAAKIQETFLRTLMPRHLAWISVAAECLFFPKRESTILLFLLHRMSLR